MIRSILISAVVMLSFIGYAGAKTWVILPFIPYAIDGNNILGSASQIQPSNGDYYVYNLTTGNLTTINLSVIADRIWATGISGNNIVGWYQDATNHGFIYNMTTQNWTTFDCPYPTVFAGTYVSGVCGNNIVGYYYDDSVNRHGFLYDGLNWSNFAYPTAVPGTYFETVTFGISGDNIVGEYWDCTTGVWTNFLYNTATQSWTTLIYPGTTSNWAGGISGDNIVGEYLVDGTMNTYGFLYNIKTQSWTTLAYSQDQSTSLSGISGSKIIGNSGGQGFIYYDPYSGGTGEPNNPYQIATKADLLALALDKNDYDKCFILTADIDLAGQVFTTAVIAANPAGGSDFIGTAFTGIFDGNGHKISNLNIDGGCCNSTLGLFGQIELNGSVSNLCIENCQISGAYNVGGLAGSSNGNISNCSSSGSITAYIAGGGLVGYNGDGNISNCHSAATVSGSIEWDFGGLVGLNAGNIINSYSTGAVSGGWDVGGLVGSDGGSTRNCHSTGSVSGSYYYIGGLVGQGYNISGCYSTSAVNGDLDCEFIGGLAGAGDSISNCYATGAVSFSSSSSSLIGGLMGNCGPNISNCYSTGRVSGPSGAWYVGGLIGQASGSPTNCFWDVNSSAQSASDGGTGLTTAQMRTRSTFTSAGWDFTNETANGTSDYWRLCADGVSYPGLNWEYAQGGDFACPDGVGMDDVAYFAARWLENDCAYFNNCGGADMNASGAVDFIDYALFVRDWFHPQWHPLN